MVRAMTIITTFISPYLIKFGWNFAGSFVNKESNKKLRSNNKNKNFGLAY
jgi:hypothetical protein